MAKRKTLFDDRPVEISVCFNLARLLHVYWLRIQELTFIIKQDIANINKQIAGLQSYVKQRNAQGNSGSPEAKQIDEHNHNVVMLLQSKLANTSMGFKDVLEIRTQVSPFAILQCLRTLNIWATRIWKSRKTARSNLCFPQLLPRIRRRQVSTVVLFASLHQSDLVKQPQTRCYSINSDKIQWAMEVPI